MVLVPSMSLSAEPCPPSVTAMATASGVRKIGERVERKDLWWIEPLTYVLVLGGFVEIGRAHV